ncbi:MAG: tetratricopeptide repeat protein [Myxococcota bacterium]
MQQQFDESAVHYENAIALGDATRTTHAELASVYDVTQRYDDAIRIYRYFLNLHPQDASMHQELGLTLMLTKRYKESVLSLAEAYRLAPQSAQVEEDYAYALLSAGKTSEAEQHLLQVLKQHGDRPIALQHLAQLSAARGDTDAAVSLLSRSIAISNQDPRPVRMRARVRILAGDLNGALADYQMLLRALPTDPGALLGASGVQIQLDKLDDAAVTIDRLQQATGQSELVDYRRAQIAWRRGAPQAVAVIGRFAELHPEIAEAWSELEAAATKHKMSALAKRAAARRRSVK